MTHIHNELRAELQSHLEMLEEDLGPDRETARLREVLAGADATRADRFVGDLVASFLEDGRTPSGSEMGRRTVLGWQAGEFLMAAGMTRVAEQGEAGLFKRRGTWFVRAKAELKCRTCPVDVPCCMTIEEEDILPGDYSWA